MRRFCMVCFAGYVAYILAGCTHTQDQPPAQAQTQEEAYTVMRQQMIDEQIKGRGVTDPRVLEALEAVPRHQFVPEAYRDQAYEDTPLPIGEDQTISQPYIVGLMSTLLELKPTDKVLEIGTGSGYQAAVLSHLADSVYTIEIIPALGERARRVLAELGYHNVHVRIGDGYLGWPEEAPFNAIIVTAAPPRVPEPLIEQLAIGGRMVIPVGDFDQDLRVLVKTETGIETRSIIPVRFVPMTGEAQKQR